MSPCGTTEQGKIVLLSQWMLDEHKKYIDYQFDSVCLLENPIALIKPWSSQFSASDVFQCLWPVLQGAHHSPWDEEEEEYIFKSSCKCEHITCKKAIMNTQKHLERLEGAPWSILIIFLMHQFWVQFCFDLDLIHHMLLWKVLERNAFILVSALKVLPHVRQGTGLLPSPLSSSAPTTQFWSSVIRSLSVSLWPVSHWCFEVKISPQLWQVSSLVMFGRGELLRSSGMVCLRVASGVERREVVGCGSFLCFIRMCCFNPFSVVAL